MELDPGMHIGMHLVSFGKSGVTDELMLRHDVCSLSISEIHTWIKKSIEHTCEKWRTKEVDWGAKSKCSPSPHPPPDHHVTFDPKIKRDQGQHILDVGFEPHPCGHPPRVIYSLAAVEDGPSKTSHPTNKYSKDDVALGNSPVIPSKSTISLSLSCQTGGKSYDMQLVTYLYNCM
jgi:hypothetical protein